jgi:ABC-type sugar transport system ATPase subunit
MDNEVRLTVEQLRKVFGDVVVLDGVSYTFQAGKIYGLVGENGAGKSTFVRILAGLIAATEGTATLTVGSQLLRGKDLARRVSAVPQIPNFVPDWAALRNVFLGSEEKQWGLINADRQKSKAAEIEACLFPLPLGRPDSWTPAERTRVAIFRALMQRPYILIVDESLAALERIDRAAFRRYLRRYADSGRIVLVISHDLNDVQKRRDDDGAVFYDEVIVFRRGTARAVGPSDDLVSLVFDSDGTKPDPLSDRRPADSVSHDGYLLEATFRFGTSNPLTLSVRPGELRTWILRTDQQVQDVYEILSGLRRDSKRSVSRLNFEGKSLTHRGLEERTLLGMRFIPPRREDRLAKGLSTLENLHLSRALGRLRSMWRRNNLRPSLVATLKRFDFVGVLEIPVRTLSGGNQQKLVLAQVLDEQAKCIVAANAFAGLDDKTQAQTVRELQEFCRDRKGGVLLLASDNLDFQRLSLTDQQF